MVHALRQEFEAQLAAQRAAWDDERKALIAHYDRRMVSTAKIVTKPKVRAHAPSPSCRNKAQT